MYFWAQLLMHVSSLVSSEFDRKAYVTVTISFGRCTLTQSAKQTSTSKLYILRESRTCMVSIVRIISGLRCSGNWFMLSSVMDAVTSWRH